MKILDTYYKRNNSFVGNLKYGTNVHTCRLHILKPSHFLNIGLIKT